MALKKVIETLYGISVGYHKVIITNVDWLNQKAHIEVVSYIDQEARESGKRALSAFALDYEGDGFDFSVDDNLVQKTYEKIKSLPEFIDAEDC